MSYLPTQRKIELNTLYEIAKTSPLKKAENTLFINSGTVDIYISESTTVPTDTTQMYKQDAGIYGLRAFDMIPRYMVIMQNSGATTEIVLEGLKAVDLGILGD